MPELSKAIILFGIALVLTGLALSAGAHISWLGKLPGDIAIKKENFQFYFPVTTCVLISAVLSLLLRVFRK